MTYPASPAAPLGTSDHVLLTLAWQRLRTHLCTHVDTDGAIRDRCASRVLESALALDLLRSTGSHPRQQRRLAAYLAKRSDTSDPLERVLTGGAALTRAPAPGRSTDMAGQPRALLRPAQTPAAGNRPGVLGALPLTAIDVSPPTLVYAGYARWVEVILCAVKLVHMTARRIQAPAERAFWRKAWTTAVTCRYGKATRWHT